MPLKIDEFPHVAFTFQYSKIHHFLGVFRALKDHRLQQLAPITYIKENKIDSLVIEYLYFSSEFTNLILTYFMYTLVHIFCASIYTVYTHIYSGF